MEIITPTILGIEIIAGSIILAWIIKIISKKAIQPLLKKTETSLDDQIFEQISLGFFWTTIMIGLNLGAPQLLEILKTSGYQNTIYTGITLIWTFLTEKIITSIFEVLIKNQKNNFSRSEKGMFSFLKSVSIFVTASIALTITFIIWEIDITPLIASAGVAGVAIGFAAKDTVSNFFGGISIFFDKPFKLGDYVIIENKYRGEVIKIGIRSTKIKTRDNILLTIPNSAMITKVVVNETGHDNKLRIRIPLGVDYDTDLENAEDILKEIIKKNSSLVLEPNNPVLYRNFGPSAINLDVLAILNEPANKGVITHKLIKVIHKRFQEEGIKMPAPQREIKIIK